MKLISLEDDDKGLDDYCDMKLSTKLNKVPEISEKDVDHFISPQSINFF